MKFYGPIEQRIKDFKNEIKEQVSNHLPSQMRRLEDHIIMDETLISLFLKVSNEDDYKDFSYFLYIIH